jgi:hypothetical protein
MKLTALRDTAAPETNRRDLRPDIKETIVSKTTTPLAARAAWIRNVNDYDRRQPREYAVTRFG